MRSSDFAIQRTCAAPIPGFSGARLNLTSETLWIICALPRKVSSGSPTFMPMYSQRSIAARSELGEGHRSPLGIEFYNTDEFSIFARPPPGGPPLTPMDAAGPDHLFA